MQVESITLEGKPTGVSVELADEVFGKEFNPTLVHQIVTAYLAGGRQGTKAQKNRSAVSGGGAKPWRQKGTGRARAGTIRSPQWRGGGVTFAAQPRDYSQKVNRKMLRAAYRCILSELVRNDRLLVIDEIVAESSKTKDLATKLAPLNCNNAMIIVETVDDNLYLASRNIANITLTDVSCIDPVSLVKFEKVVITSQALKSIEEWLR